MFNLVLDFVTSKKKPIYPSVKPGAILRWYTTVVDAGFIVLAAASSDLRRPDQRYGSNLVCLLTPLLVSCVPTGRLCLLALFQLPTLPTLPQ
jgi:hypothetical protein